jgi:hypothetical protein
MDPSIKMQVMLQFAAKKLTAGAAKKYNTYTVRN